VDAEEARDDQRPARHRGHGELVLVVDDEEAVQALAEDVLHRNGYKVILAEDAAAALASLREHGASVAVVLTDFMMPGGDGLALLDAVRQQFPAVPVIVMTGVPSVSMGADASARGAAGFLEKPFSATALLSVLHTVLGPARRTGTDHLPRGV
jgi:DNA-binding NtrC family response regulator